MPAWRTVRSAVVLRDAGLPFREVMLATATLRFAYRFKTLDVAHPLITRIYRKLYKRGLRAREICPLCTRLLYLDNTLDEFPQPVLEQLKYPFRFKADPISGIGKAEAAKAFKE